LRGEAPVLQGSSLLERRHSSLRVAISAGEDTTSMIISVVQRLRGMILLALSTVDEVMRWEDELDSSLLWSLSFLSRASLQNKTTHTNYEW